MKKILITSATMLLLAGTAQAGEAGDLAQAHIDAIAAGDVEAITSVYGDGATLTWVGGPLDGMYEGDGLAEVWGKFTTAQTGLTATVSDLTESTNDKGSTVVANVVFANANTIPVRYVMTFRGGELVNEIWQIDPSLAQ